MSSYEEWRPIAPLLPPESMTQILKHLEDDIKSLHSCLLVNRHWCRQSVSFLWVEPFTSKLSKNSIISLLNTYFGRLKDEDKRLFLTKTRMILPLKRPIFNYESFLQKLNTRLLGDSVSLWVNNNNNLTFSNKNEITNLILKLLYKLFIQSDARLNSLTLDVSAGSMDIAAEISLFRENLKFISNIRKLNCIFSNPESSEIFYNMSDLWNELPKICKRIKILDVDANDMHWSSGQTLANLIQSQKELSNVKFRSSGSRVTSAVAMLAKSDTLTSLEFEYIDFRKVSLDGLEHCTKLEKIRIIGGKDCNVETFRPLINAKCKIKTLELNEIYESESLKFLLDNIGWSLEHLIINPMIKEILPKSCPHITYLNISVMSPFIPQMLSLISGCQLEYLVIRSRSINDSEIIVNEMGKIVPLSLHYLELLMPLSSNQLNTFLMDCQAPLRTLIVDSYPFVFLTDSHINAIKRFTIRKGTLKYINIVTDGLNLDDNRIYIDEIRGYLKFLPLDQIVIRY